MNPKLRSKSKSKSDPPSRRDSTTLRFTARIGVLSHLPGMHYLEIPARIIELLKKSQGHFKIRLICTVNGKLSFQCGIVALGEGRGYISITRKRLKELELGAGASAQVTLKPDSSRFGMPVAEELEALLAQDDEGRRRFDQLTPGKQRYIIFYVNGVKSSDRRVERAILLIDNLKRLPEGKETFREMLGLPRK